MSDSDYYDSYYDDDGIEKPPTAKERWEAGWADDHEWCPCRLCRGRRAFTAYERTGAEPNWGDVRYWRAREDWLANATRTVRRGLVGPPPRKETEDG